MAEVHDIFVRAHTIVPQKEVQRRSSPAIWPEEVLVFDTESTTDTAQRLNFGVYCRCKLGTAGYQRVEEGLFYSDDLDVRQREVLDHYVHDPKNLPKIDIKMFPPQTRINLYSRSDFVKKVLWRAIRKGAMVVGFNLPFDLSRLAIKSTIADDEGWSLVLSFRKSRKTGEMEPNPERPRVVITSKGSSLVFISLKGILHPQEWPHEGRFLDLHTLGRALRDKSYKLDDACKDFNVDGKLKHKPTGRVTLKEIDYCRQDVRATVNMLNAMKREFDRHPFELRPDRAYSPASIAKAYLEAMNISLPKAKFDVADRELGIAMQGYFGGRAECRNRKTPLPVVHTDFTSQYPTVNALLGNWDVLKADNVHFEGCTEDVHKMLAKVKLEDTFRPAFWKRLSFFALLLPKEDILPVRTVYNGRTQNIGLNYLTSEQPIWFAGPDVVASALLTGKVPKIVKAIRMVPRGQQMDLKKTNLAGMVTIQPRSDDFFCHVIEQKSVHKATNKSLSHFLKILANSGSYGLFVEVNQEKSRRPVNVKVFSGEKSFERPYSAIEKSGKWYFPPLASLITAGGRLLLAMLENSVAEAGGTYLFCDTDSLCIVSNQHGGLVPCPGGARRLNGRDAVKALSWNKVEKIARRFNALNPYDPELVRDILKIEDINFIDSDPHNPQRQLFGYAISAKRYCLYTQVGRNISIVKASAHGLGYLYSPKDGFNKEVDAPEWVLEAWDWLLRKDLGLSCKEPAWLDYPAMMRMALTSPNIMRNRRPEWLTPFNFFFLPLLSDLGGYPAGRDRSNFKFISSFSSDRTKWKNLTGINLCDGTTYRLGMSPDGKQDKVVPESLRIVLRLYLRRPESKSLAPDLGPCVADTRGLLKRASIVAREIIAVGKETDRRWEEGEDMSMEYHPFGNMGVPDRDLIDETKKHGLRELMRETGLSQHTIEAVRKGQPVRRATLKRIQAAIASKGRAISQH